MKFEEFEGYMHDMQNGCISCMNSEETEHEWYGTYQQVNAILLPMQTQYYDSDNE